MANTLNDPEFTDALRQLFATRSDLKVIVDYQQRLFASLQELTNNHRAVHEHVRNLTESHNRVQSDTTALSRLRDELAQSLRNLDMSHQQTRDEVRNALNAINYAQQEIRKVSQLEDRIEKLEREVQRLWQDDKQDDRKRDDQEQRLRKMERR